MDNVTHTLFALTLARTPLSRAGRGTLAALLISSNAPDIDVLSAGGGGLSYLKWHRGPTHGPLGIAGLGLVSAGLVHLGRRFLDDRRTPATRAVNASFSMLVAVSIIGALVHVAMDFPTSYGTRLLSPFDWHWFAVDWMPIVDLYLLAALTAGLILGSVSKGSERRLAAIVLAVAAANYGIRAAAHHQALVLAPRFLGHSLPPACETSATGSKGVDRWPDDHAAVAAIPRVAPASAGHAVTAPCLVEIAALPTFTSPFRWRIIEHLSNGYEVRQLDLISSDRPRVPRMVAPPQSGGDGLEAGREGFWRWSVRYPDVWTAATVAAARTRTARVFLGFARFPAARPFVDASGASTIRWSDVRFTTGFLAEPMLSTNLFTVFVRLDSGGNVLQEAIGRDPGRGR
jgi:membrane-bound metal-dependent hydrolase YbcI (DUF457 family)